MIFQNVERSKSGKILVVDKLVALKNCLKESGSNNKFKLNSSSNLVKFLTEISSFFATDWI